LTSAAASQAAQRPAHILGTSEIAVPRAERGLDEVEALGRRLAGRFPEIVTMYAVLIVRQCASSSGNFSEERWRHDDAGLVERLKTKYGGPPRNDEYPLR
jgi:hypothetical protein